MIFKLAGMKPSYYNQQKLMRIVGKLLRKFLKEEEAQGALEYLFLATGIIIAMIIVYTAYYRISKSSGEEIENATVNATAALAQILANATKT